MKKRYIHLLLVIMIFPIGRLAAQQPVKAADWSAWQFILGEWVGTGSGAPGQGTGSFTFSYDLEKRILVRKNHTEFPKTDKSPAFTHEDLMIVYQENDRTKAVYWDNEGHVINYIAGFSQDGNKLYFTSEAAAQAPRFRLVYEKLGDNKMNNVFEIAAPGKPDQFSKYLEAVVIKK
jgi:hypothetical protein